MVRYPVQVALGLFITVGGLLMAAFLTYQVCVGLIELGWGTVWSIPDATTQGCTAQA